MSRAELPEDIRRFILTSVPSVPYLEAILLLRTDPAVLWDVPRMAARLYVAEKQAAEVLTALVAAGIAQDDGVRLISYGLILVAIWQKNR